MTKNTGNIGNLKSLDILRMRSLSMLLDGALIIGYWTILYSFNFLVKKKKNF